MLWFCSWLAATWLCLDVFALYAAKHYMFCFFADVRYMQLLYAVSVFRYLLKTRHLRVWHICHKPGA